MKRTTITTKAFHHASCAQMSTPCVRSLRELTASPQTLYMGCLRQWPQALTVWALCGATALAFRLAASFIHMMRGRHYRASANFGVAGDLTTMPLEHIRTSEHLLERRASAQATQRRWWLSPASGEHWNRKHLLMQGSALTEFSNKLAALQFLHFQVKSLHFQGEHQSARATLHALQNRQVLSLALPFRLALWRLYGWGIKLERRPSSDMLDGTNLKKTICRTQSFT